MPGAATGDARVEVVEVSGRRLRSEFLGFPGRLYRGLPGWVPPLLLEQRLRAFGPGPFFEHARVKTWLARRSGRVVGRISAQVDELQARQQGDGVGYFGMLDAEDDAAVFAALLGTAERWLREQGMIAVRGPYNLSINQEVGLLVENFEQPPFIMMGHAPPYARQQLDAQGYAGVQDLLTYTIHPDFETPAMMGRLARRAAQTVRVRPLRRAEKAEDFEILRDIFNDAWSGNWGFVPYTRAEFSDMARTLALLLKDEDVQIAEIGERPVAFIVGIPNLNEIIADLDGRLLPWGWARLLWRLRFRPPKTARVALMGVRREYQHSRLGPTLAFMVIDALREEMIRRRVTSVEMGWILESNAGMRHIIELIGGSMY